MERPMAELPVLLAQGGPLAGLRWTIASVLHIGRDQDCEIVIPDRQVSRVHARFTLTPEGILLEDLNSKNGTFCNGVRLEAPCLIKDGDYIQIALIQDFVFLSSDATLPLDQSILPIDWSKSTDHAKIFLDAKSRRVWVSGQELDPPLSVPQFRLLQVIYEQEGEVVSRNELVAAIWGEENAQGVSEQALDALVRRLRERLTSLDNQSDFIVTVRGHGIRLENK
ncbi:MAG: hypothetical protein BGO78_04735 [Chloroflexi bacterium 44-23]|nr:MAG: hypothetical protein BGO78_04735 [Chloroflexi bacterium 44-23]